MSTATASAYRASRPLAASIAATLALSALAGCYESHVARLAPEVDGGGVPNAPMLEGGLPPTTTGADGGSSTDAGTATDAAIPDVDAGPPPSCELPRPVWALGAGDDGPQTPRAVVMDAAGNTYVGGYFGGTLANLGDPPFLESEGYQDAFVAKLSASGEVLWRRRFGGGGWSYVLALALDADGQPIVGGAFAGAFELDAFSFAASGGQDGFVARLDAGDGHVRNAVRIGGAERKSVTDLVVDTASATTSVIAVGVFDDCPFGGSTVPCQASSFDDLFVARLDDELVVRRVASYGSSGYQDAWGVALDDDRRLAVTGSFENTLAFGGPTPTLTASSGSDAFVATFDLPADLSAPFAPVWSVSYGSGGCATPLHRKGTDVAFGPSDGARGDVYVVGDFSGCMFIEDERYDVAGSAGVTDSFVARLDADDGSTLGKLILANANWQQLTSIERDRDGSLLVGGATVGTLPLGGETVSVPPGRHDMLLFRLLPPMTVDWLRTYGAVGSFVSLVSVATPPPGSPIGPLFSVSANYVNEIVFDADAGLVASSGGAADLGLAGFVCEP